MFACVCVKCQSSFEAETGSQDNVFRQAAPPIWQAKLEGSSEFPTPMLYFFATHTALGQKSAKAAVIGHPIEWEIP